jgi:hypothetical protein
MHTTGMSFKAIGRQMGYHYTVVSRLVRKHTQTNNVKDLPDTCLKLCVNLFISPNERPRHMPQIVRQFIYFLNERFRLCLHFIYFFFEACVWGVH